MAQMASEKQELEKKLQDAQVKVEEQDEMLKFCLTIAEVKKECDTYRYCAKWEPKTIPLFKPQVGQLVHLSNRHKWLQRNGKVGEKTTEADRLKYKSADPHKKWF